MTLLNTKAVIYTRFSPRRNAEQSESCETQQTYCEQHAYNKGWEVLEVFNDKEVSGKDADRPKLWAAVDALRPGYVLLVYKYDRLARDVYLSETIRKTVDKIGARIEAVSGDIEGDGPEAVMIRQILASMAEYERKVIGIRTKHAMRMHQINGRRMGRRPPYGTMIDPDNPKRLIVDPREKPAVDRIRALHNGGASVHDIVMHLISAFPELARGSVGWNGRTVKRVIDRL